MCYNPAKAEGRKELAITVGFFIAGIISVYCSDILINIAKFAIGIFI